MPFTHHDRNRLIRCERMLVSLLQDANLTEIKMSELSDAVAELTTKVEADKTVDDSAVTLLQGLTAINQQLLQQVAAAADVPAAVAAVKAANAALAEHQAALASAVSANTPAAPTA